MYCSTIALFSCNNIIEDTVYNPDLVFTNSFRINVEPYQYSDSGSVFMVWGDSTAVADTVSNIPVFRWTDVWPDYLAVAVSTEPFNVVNGTIANADQIIWMWNPGMESGVRGNVSFLEGKPVKNKNILSEKQPLPLQNGLYYWAAWYWDNGGRTILFSTQEQVIYIK